jgi:polygalacturonase
MRASEKRWRWLGPTVLFLALAVLLAVALVRQHSADARNEGARQPKSSTGSSPSGRPTDGSRDTAANVASYGAVPNDGQDDAASIERALAAAKTVTFPPGRYDIRARSVQPRNGQRLIFQPGAVLAAAPFIPNAEPSKIDHGIRGSHNRAAMEIVGVHDVDIENVGIYGWGDVQRNGQLMGINVLGHSRRITIRGGRVRDVSGDGRGRAMGDGVYIGTTDTLRRMDPSVPQDVRIIDLLVENSDRQGVAAVEVRGLSITGSTFRNNRSAGVDVEPNFARGINEDVVVADSTFDDNGLGVNVSDFAKRTRILRNNLSVTGKDPRADNISTLGQGTEIRGNQIRRGHHCVFVAGLAGQDGFGVGGAAGSVVADNDMAGCKVGVRVSARNVSVTNNTIASMSDQGVILDGSLPTERARGSTVTGNRLRDCSRPGIEFSVAILAADALDAKITNNIVTDSRGVHAADFGIQLHGLVEERRTHMVSGNRVQGTVKADFVNTP